MPIQGYGLLTARVLGRQREASSDTPHFQIRDLRSAAPSARHGWSGDSIAVTAGCSSAPAGHEIDCKYAMALVTSIASEGGCRPALAFRRTGAPLAS